MSLGIRGTTEAERVARLRGSRELLRVRESARRRRELRLAFRRIAAEREDVLDAGIAELIEDLAELARGVADAGEMGHRLEPDFALDARHEFDGEVASAPARAVGDRHERDRKSTRLNSSHRCI